MKARVGQWVRHGGTKGWGRVIRTKKCSDGSTEHEIVRERVYVDVAHRPIDQGHVEVTIDTYTYWWASYHIDRVQAKRPTDAERTRFSL